LERIYHTNPSSLSCPSKTEIFFFFLTNIDKSPELRSSNNNTNVQTQNLPKMDFSGRACYTCKCGRILLRIFPFIPFLVIHCLPRRGCYRLESFLLRCGDLCIRTPLFRLSIKHSLPLGSARSKRRLQSVIFHITSIDGSIMGRSLSQPPSALRLALRFWGRPGEVSPSLAFRRLHCHGYVFEHIIKLWLEDGDSAT